MRFLLIIVLVVLTSCATSKKDNIHQIFAGNENFASIMQGATDKSKTVINFLVPTSYKYKVSIQDQNKQQISSFVTSEHRLDNKNSSVWKLIIIQLKELDYKNRYNLEIEFSKDNYSFKENRYFSTLNTDKRDWKLFIASCQNDSNSDVANKIWPNIISKSSDAYFFIGDNIYGDFFNGYGVDTPIDARHFWHRFVDSRLKIPFYRLKNLTPVFAIWDDHDFGLNNGNSTFKLKDETRRIFRQFFPMIKSEAINNGPSLSFGLKLGEENFYFLDNRYYRKEGKDKDHLGPAQLKWFQQSLQNDSSRFYLVKGDQFFGKYHSFESYEGNNPAEFARFLNILKDSQKKFTFISGDRHYLELLKIEPELYGQKAFEITTSAVHAKLFNTSFERFPNPRRIGGFDDEYNYVILDIHHGTDDSVDVKFKSYNEKDKLLLDHKFHL